MLNVQNCSLNYYLKRSNILGVKCLIDNNFYFQEFGKTPVYLTKRKEEIQAAQEEYNSYVSERCRRGAMKQLSDAERHAILHGLKSNWDEIHHLYQGLSVVTDTAPKKNRKERMEAEMKQLERDIELVEKHRIIYIAN